MLMHCGVSLQTQTLEKSMASRALIIAIENYSGAEGRLTSPLKGTVQAGLDFVSWLREKWNVEGLKPNNTQIIFCSDPPQPGHIGAKRSDILNALLKLKQDGRSMTEELYVFFSGHGFAFVEKPGSRADIIITADFVNRNISGDCCLNLDLIVLWLRNHLGPGRHYYFVDACRNALNGNQITIGSLLPTDPQAIADASTFVLQSTVDGAVAAVGGSFPTTLLAGLRGAGKAKVWDPAVNDAMVVKYESLIRFVGKALEAQQAVTSRVEGQVTASEAVLATIRPIPLYTLTVKLLGSDPGDEGKLLLKRGRSATGEEVLFHQSPPPLQREPDDYSVLVSLKNGLVTASDPPLVSLFEDKTLRFQKTLVPPTPGSGVVPPNQSTLESFEASTIAELNVLVPKDAQFKLRNLETGNVHVIDSSMTLKLPQGRYSASLRSKGNFLLKRSEIIIKAGESVPLNLAEWRNSIPHISIASQLPQQDGAPDFSESLGGGVTDPDLGLWLALLGGGRILGSQGDYSKIAHFPLHDFSREKVGVSPAYILAGFENPETTLEVSVSQTAEPNWQRASEVLPGICEAYFAARSGSQLVSFRLGNQAPYTLASFTSPNRGMLITLTIDEQGELNLAQYLLPLGHLIDQLPEEVKQRIKWRNHLQDVRFLAQANRAFQNRRVLRLEFKTDELMELLYAKWLDPIGLSLASYELLRRGKKDSMGEVVSNMKKFFPDLPDTAALAKLSGHPTANPRVPPLFLDGLRAYPDYAEWLPLPASNLDFTSTWTAWRAALGK
jgi:hypothetical protein